MDPISLVMGLATLVPDVLKYFGHGNAAATAEKVVNIAQKVTGAKDGEAILDAVKSNPELLLKLQQEIDANSQALAKLSQEVTLSKIKADSDNYSQSVVDRKSAREMQVSTRSYTTPALAFVITVGFFGVLYFMLMHDVPKDSRDVLNIMLGSLGTAWVSVVAFYFGSSAGSQQKNVLLAQAPSINEIEK